jgi:4-amino-4-deoxy-L-arabinose transferase-like glycosyltransferase
MRINFPNSAAVALRNALINPARRERTVLIALGVYVVLWTIYGTIAKGSQGLHYDMTEVVAWSRDLSLGYLKHPPLAGWIVWLWFTVFPFAEWSYYLLAMVMPAIALWFAWRLSADYLSIEKRIMGLALLTLVPFYNFHALKFNVNTVLMPAWAATTYWFLQSYRTRSALYAALAGVGAAACMLGKYWSVFLLAGLIVAALADARRGKYFRSPAPWITVAAGLVLLAPHIVWLVQNDFMPFTYAMSVHGEKSLATAAYGVAGYLVGSAGYVAIPLIVVIIAAWPSRATLTDMIWPAEPDRRLVAAAFWGPLLLPVPGSLFSATEITSLWSMSAWTLLPVLLLSPEAVRLNAADTRRVLIAALAVPLVMLIASPLIAIVNGPDGIARVPAQAQQLAAEVERRWHDSTALPLRFVGGDGEIVLPVIAFAADKPRPLLAGLPLPGAAELARAGKVLLCVTGDAGCLRDVAADAGSPSKTTQTDIVQTVWGKSLPPRNYTIIVVPPQP